MAAFQTPTPGNLWEIKDKLRHGKSGNSFLLAIKLTSLAALLERMVKSTGRRRRRTKDGR